ncbi:MAG: zinc-dependent peptidase [Bacteroidota bacterium]
MFIRLVAFPFIVIAIGLMYLAWEVDRAYAIFILPCSVVLALLYIFSPQIDWWWAQRHPPQLDRGIRTLLERYSIFYQSLNPLDKEKFRNRLVWFMMAKEFHGQVMEQVPEDVKGIIAANAVHLTFGLEDYRFDKFENIVVYAHPFPSPQYLEHWHTSEIHAEDGAVLFSAEHLMSSFVQPRRYYNIGLHEFVKIQMLTYPDKAYPRAEELNWDEITQISGWTEEFISAWIGLPDIALDVVAVVAYLTFPVVFEQHLPDMFRRLESVLVSKKK